MHPVVLINGLICLCYMMIHMQDMSLNLLYVIVMVYFNAQIVSGMYFCISAFLLGMIRIEQVFRGWLQKNFSAVVDGKSFHDNTLSIR